MKILYKLLKQDPSSREGIISVTSVLGILANLLIAAVKVVIGLLASSIAIMSEGVNNASDALTSVLALIGTKLAGKHPDEKHPFGYGRIEYLTSLVIAILILVTGVEMLTSSVKLVFAPEEMSISILSLVIIAASALIKFFLGIYTIRMGKKADSSTLEAVGIECRNDSFISVITILSAVIFLVFRLSIDAYVGIFTSLIIIKAGLEVLRDTVGDLLGRPGEKELANKLYKEIRSTDGILNAADMMLHNYGPDAYSGSVNVEIDQSKSVGDVYQFLHELQLRIMHEYHVTMVFGVYAVDNDRENSKEFRRMVGQFVTSHEHVKSFHAVYLDPHSDKLYCDLVVDYNLRDWEPLKEEFSAYMKEKCPDKTLELTIETEFV
ncbi:MAG: cation diffusion facilitator family transporter [Clostridia bacterium]|nr:cation diffusion facilitator family transporter [Clostridia bacterium]